MKAVGLLGAVSEAQSRGMVFSALAGTSAGSIVAALLGAGAKPEFLEKKLRELADQALLGSPEKMAWDTTPWARFLLPLCKRLDPMFGYLAHSYTQGGAHSSRKLETWTNSLLRQLLPDAETTVKFRELPKPTQIVATDLTSGKAKVWGTNVTPDDSVSYAIRCSCSIPFFFQPVSQGTSIYVDGGILSNLPTFVFSDDTELSQDPIIAFSLFEHSRRNIEIRDLKTYLTSLYTTVVDGAEALQFQLGPRVYPVNVDVSGIDSTDFSILSKEPEVLRLVEAGRKAFSDFAKSYEAGEVDDHANWNRPDLHVDESEAYSWLVSECEQPLTEIIVSATETRWFWSLFPTVLNLLMRGVRISALVGPTSPNPQEAEKEQQRRAYMEMLGVEIREQESLPALGFWLFDDMSAGSHHRALVLLHGTENGSDYAKSYKGPMDEALLDLSRKELTDHAIPASDVAKPVISRMEARYFIERLSQGVEQYAGPNCTIELEEVPLDRILVLNKYLRASKYKQIGYLYSAFEEAGLRYFEPAYIEIRGRFVSPVTPPVLEETGDRCVAIEGNTRVYYAWRSKISHLTALVVRGVASQLPGEPAEPSHCIVDSKKRVAADRIRGFNWYRFRHIERAIRPLQGSSK